MREIIKFAERKDIKEVVELSERFEREQCCNGVKADTEEFFKDKQIAVAIVDEKIY